MAIAWKNLDAHVKNMINGSYPDIGQTFYMVDSDFRTAAQGWSNAEGTGPLDLYAKYGSGAATYVYYAPGTGQPSGVVYDRDQLAIQAAIDAMTDFRGDTLFFTPGSYSIGTTALEFNVANARYLGPPVPTAYRSAVTLTDAIGDNNVSVDNNEFAFMKFVPLTAQNFFQTASGADFGYMHDYLYDAQGIAASTSTEFVAGTTNEGWVIRRGTHVVDAAQGDAFALTSSTRWLWEDCDFYVELTTVAWASVFTFITSALGNIARRCTFRGCGGSTPAVFTNIFTGVANVNGQLLITDCRVDGTALATASGIETTFGAATDVELIETYQSGDATGEGGVVIALA